LSNWHKSAAIGCGGFISDLSTTIAEPQTSFGFNLGFEYFGFYASLSRDGATINIRGINHAVKHNRENDIQTADMYILVSNVDAPYRELTQSRAIIIKLSILGYSNREFHVEDCSGNRLGSAKRVV